MGKIGILTFHDAHNYGAVLQAYALKKYLKNLGLDATIINYHHYNIPDGFPKKRIIKEKTIHNVAKHIYSHKDHNLRWGKFNKFIKELVDNEERVYTSEEELSKLDIDYWICGSDQIWNTEITRGFNKGFFLDFKTKGKKISYAVSMGILALDEEHEKDFEKAVNQIDCISVREESLKEYIQKFSNKEVLKVVDPTLLLERKDYEDILEENKIKEKYLLLYELVPDERLAQSAKKIAKEKNLKIVELNDFKKIRYFCDQISNAGPEEFLTLIKNAETIVTNSFHGTIFSIIFGKDFYTIARTKNNSRIENILKVVDMEDRMINKIEDIDNVKKQDYDNVYKLLEKETEKSKKFLIDSLEVKK